MFPPNETVDAVVTELDKQLGLVGEHNMTTALRPDTVEPWIEMQIDGALGDDGFNQIVQRRCTRQSTVAHRSHCVRRWVRFLFRWPLLTTVGS